MKGFFNETVRLTCIVTPASHLTSIQFSFNDRIYRDGNFHTVSYPDGITVSSTYHIKNCSVESTLIIEHFRQQFVGQYSCSSSIFGSGGVTGNNLTFDVISENVEGTSEYI